MKHISEYEDRADNLCKRLGVNRENLKRLPIHLWAVPLLEKMLDAIEHLEDSVYGKRQGSGTERT